MSLSLPILRHYNHRRTWQYMYSYLQPCIFSKNFSSLDSSSEEKPVKKKTTPVPKITLHSGSSMSVTTLEEAQKLSRRRELKLVKILDLDTKTQRPVYKLMNGSEYYQEELKQREARKTKKNSSFIKGDKLLLLKDSIDEHDLNIQAKKILKWLSKSYQVNVVISGSGGSMEKTEQIFKSLEKLVNTEGRILQKTIKGFELKFYIIPPKRENKEDL